MNPRNFSEAIQFSEEATQLATETECKDCGIFFYPLTGEPIPAVCPDCLADIEDTWRNLSD